MILFHPTSIPLSSSPSPISHSPTEYLPEAVKRHHRQTRKPNQPTETEDPTCSPNPQPPCSLRRHETNNPVPSRGEQLFPKSIETNGLTPPPPPPPPENCSRTDPRWVGMVGMVRWWMDGWVNGCQDSVGEKGYTRLTTSAIAGRCARG
jgi:hypothetical protein